MRAIEAEGGKAVGFIVNATEEGSIEAIVEQVFGRGRAALLMGSSGLFCLRWSATSVLCTSQCITWELKSAAAR